MNETNLNNKNSLSQEKVDAIETTINELEMSKEELIELIRKILEAEIEITSKTEEKDKNLQNLDNITIEEIADNPTLLSKYLSEKQTSNLLIRLTFALSVQKLKPLANKINRENLEKLLEIDKLLELDMAGKAKTISGEKNLPLTKLESLNRFTESETKKQADIEKAKAPQEPSAFGKLFSEVRKIMDNATSKILVKMGDTTPQAGVQKQNDPNNQNNPNNQQRSANIMSRVNELSRQTRQLEQRIKKDNPDVQRVRFNGRNLTARIIERPRGQNRDIFGNRVESQSKSKEVNLDDYLKEQNKLSPDLQKELDINLQKQKDIELEMKIQQKEGEISTLKSKADSLKFSVDDKNWSNSSSASRGIAITPDSLNNQANQQNLSVEAIAASQAITLDTKVDSKNQGKKEALKTSTDLVKLDAIHDKEKMMSEMKNSPEMKDVAHHMKKITEDLKEAEKNKDLLKEIKNQRFQDKFQGK